MSDPINATIENDITLVKNVIRIGNDEYGFDFTDFSKSHYYKENDVVTVIKDGVIYKHTVSGVYPNNTQMKYMKLDEPEAGKVEFSATPKSGFNPLILLIRSSEILNILKLKIWILIWIFLHLVKILRYQVL